MQIVSSTTSMKTFTQKHITYGVALVSFPFMLACSVLGGGSSSNNPAIRAQEERVSMLKSELDEAERRTKEAQQFEKAAESRLKAAEHELKALKLQDKARNQ
jgi:hypothetical protein